MCAGQWGEVLPPILERAGWAWGYVGRQAGGGTAGLRSFRRPALLQQACAPSAPARWTGNIAALPWVPAGNVAQAGRCATCSSWRGAGRAA